jgi:hypothetical protein
VAAPWLINSDMSLLLVLQSWTSWAPVVFIRDSKYGMPAVQSIHLMGLTILLATVLLLDLRLAGLGMRDYGLSWLARQLKPWTLSAITVMIASGFLMFLGTPGKYVDSHPFRLKMLLLCLALLFHFRRAPQICSGRFCRAPSGGKRYRGLPLAYALVRGGVGWARDCFYSLNDVFSPSESAAEEVSSGP